MALRPAKACGKDGERGYKDNDSGGHDDDSRIGFRLVSAYLFDTTWRLFRSDALRCIKKPSLQGRRLVAFGRSYLILVKANCSF
jgi:hypothetical protein